MLIPIPYVQAGIGAMSAVVSIPLILRKVPMNRVYGIRVPKAFVSPENWYALNAYGGKLLLAFGLILLAFGVLAEGIAPPPDSPWAPVFLIAPVILLVPMIMLIVGYARRLPDK